MHEAYRLIDTGSYGFGAFISGPSKTADIEQALVMGAHGARVVKSFYYNTRLISTFHKRLLHSKAVFYLFAPQVTFVFKIVSSSLYMF